MKAEKLFRLFAICFCISTLTGCAWFRGESATSKKSQDQFSSMSQTDDMLPGISSDNPGDLVMDLGSETDLLPPRPTKDWQPVENQKVTIYFAFDQSSIGTAQIPQLEAIANYLKTHENIGLIIQGHCDERGSHEYNIGLGEKRALAVRNYLVSLGVSDTHLQTISYGSERPADPGHEETAHAKNRRADLIPAKI